MNFNTRTLIAALLLCSGTALAADYPTKPIRLVVPFPAGGPVDITARTLAPRLGDALGQRILIDNRGGAGGVLGSDIVAKSPADGHTLLLCTTGNAINVSLVPNLPYDIRKDFAPVSMVAIITSILVVHPSLPVKSVKDLIALAKAKPDALSYASTGNGAPTHLAGELFKTMAGVKIVHVPYKGAAPAVIDLISGHVQLSFISAPGAMPHVQEKRLRVLAVTNNKRSVLQSPRSAKPDSKVMNRKAGTACSRRPARRARQSTACSRKSRRCCAIRKSMRCSPPAARSRWACRRMNSARR